MGTFEMNVKVHTRYVLTTIETFSKETILLLLSPIHRLQLLNYLRGTKVLIWVQYPVVLLLLNFVKVKRVRFQTKRKVFSEIVSIYYSFQT